MPGIPNPGKDWSGDPGVARRRLEFIDEDACIKGNTAMPLEKGPQRC
jgi:hypothetical protein